MLITVQHLRLLVPTLSAEEFDVMLHTVLGLKTAESRKCPLVPFKWLRAGLYEFMVAIGFVTDSQRLRILEKVRDDLKTVIHFVEAADGDLDKLEQHYKLVFVENRYVGWTQWGMWYDMVYDEPVLQLPEPGVLHVVCDVTALYLRQRTTLAKHGVKDEPEHHAGEPAGEPGGAGPPTPP